MVRSARGSPSPLFLALTAKKKKKKNCLNGIINWYTYVVSLLTPIDFGLDWAIFGPLVAKTLKRGNQWLDQHVGPPMVRSACGSPCPLFRSLHKKVLAWWFCYFVHMLYSESLDPCWFSSCYPYAFEISVWKLVMVHNPSGLYNILNSGFTRIGSLWPTSCSQCRHR